MSTRKKFKEWGFWAVLAVSLAFGSANVFGGYIAGDYFKSDARRDLALKADNDSPFQKVSEKVFGGGTSTTRLAILSDSEGNGYNNGGAPDTSMSYRLALKLKTLGGYSSLKFYRPKQADLAFDGYSETVTTGNVSKGKKLVVLDYSISGATLADLNDATHWATFVTDNVSTLDAAIFYIGHINHDSDVTTHLEAYDVAVDNLRMINPDTEMLFCAQNPPTVWRETNPVQAAAMAASRYGGFFDSRSAIYKSDPLTLFLADGLHLTVAGDEFVASEIVKYFGDYVTPAPNPVPAQVGSFAQLAFFGYQNITSTPRTVKFNYAQHACPGFVTEAMGNASTIVVPTTGQYRIETNASFTPSADGKDYIQLYLNNSPFDVAYFHPSEAGDNVVIPFTMTDWSFTRGDRLKWVVWSTATTKPQAFIVKAIVTRVY